MENTTLMALMEVYALFLLHFFVSGVFLYCKIVAVVVVMVMLD